jgi:addiction module HigA family antidote
MPALQNQYNPQIAFHPGRTLADKLEELGMDPLEFAVRTGKPEKTIIAVLKGASSITPEMAVLFEQVLHISAHFWLNKQRNYDEFLARPAQCNFF